MNKTEDLILNWLNNEIKLDPPVRFISKEFANGYRFGEILYKIKEITENQFHEFSNKDNTYAIRDNFILVKKYFKDIYELEIRHDEFAEIINKDLCKAVIVLYKLKNSISKKSINFLNIKMTLNPKSPEEINRRVRELMDQEFYIEMLQKDLLYDIEINKTENNKFLFSSTIKTFKSSLLPSKLGSTNFSFQKKYSTSNAIEEEPEIKSKIKLININKSKEIVLKSSSLKSFTNKKSIIETEKKIKNKSKELALKSSSTKFYNNNNSVGDTEKKIKNNKSKIMGNFNQFNKRAFSSNNYNKSNKNINNKSKINKTQNNINSKNDIKKNIKNTINNIFKDLPKECEDNPVILYKFNSLIKNMKNIQHIIRNKKNIIFNEKKSDDYKNNEFEKDF
jgi:hypothetical protein